MKVEEDQTSSTKALKSSGNDLKSKNVNIQTAKQAFLKIIDLPCSEGKFGAQICIEKALGNRF